MIDFCACVYYYICTDKSEVKKMSPRTGRPTKDPKKIRLEIRLTQSQSDLLQNCADELNITRTDVINKGIELVKKEIENKK